MYQDLVRRVPVSDHVANYAARLCRATRPLDDAPDFVTKYVRYGCGPRAGQSLLLSAKAHVVLGGRFNVSCEDVRRYALPVMRHRVILNFAAASEGLDSDAIVKKLLEAVPEAQ
jgi:MoxR-like ATPase